MVRVIPAAFSSIRRLAWGSEVRTLHCPATVKGTKADNGSD